MASYLLLYSGGSMPETEAQQAEVLKGWETWYSSLAGAMVDPGNPFTQMAKNISSDGTVKDGPVGTMA